MALAVRGRERRAASERGRGARPRGRNAESGQIFENCIEFSDCRIMTVYGGNYESNGDREKDR